MKLFRIFILAFFAISLIACGGAEERKAVYMEKAKASMEAGNLDKARVELKNVLQIDPKDAEAHYQLGNIFEQQKEYMKAYKHYIRAEGLDPDLLDNQAKLGRVYLLLANDLEKAQSKIDFILSKEPDNADGLLLKATMMLKNDKKNEAVEILKEIVSGDPGHVDSVAVLASLYLREGKNKKAIAMLDEALKINNNNKTLNKLLAMILENDKDYDRAEKIYKDFLERNPDNASSYVDLAAFYNRIDEKVKAEEVLRSSISNKPDDVDRQLVLVKYIKTIKGNDEAIDELKKLVASNDGLGKLRVALAQLLYMNNNKQAAEDVYKKAISDFSENETGIEARTALASIYLSNKNYDKASDVVEEALLVSPNDPKINLLRAKLAVIDKDIEKAIISLRVVTKETPENVEAFILLANSYQMGGNREQAGSTLNSAYSNNRMNSKGLLRLAQYLLPRDIALAEKVIDDYNNIEKSTYLGLSIKSTILNQKRELLEARKIAEKIIDLYPKKANGYLQVVPYYIQERDLQKAISILEKGYITSDDNRRILKLLTTIQGADKQFDVVEKRLNTELQAAPDDEELKVLLYKVYMAKNDRDSADPLLEEIINNNTSMEDPYLWLAQSYKEKNNLEKAKLILKKGRVNVPASVKIPFSLAAIYESEKMYSRAIEIYREMYKANPNNLIVINNLASMMSDYSDNSDDLELAKVLVEKLKKNNQAVFLDTISWVYYKAGDYKNALLYSKKAVNQVPNAGSFNYHLGMVYLKLDDKDNARLYLKKAVAGNLPPREKGLAEAALKNL